LPDFLKSTTTVESSQDGSTLAATTQNIHRNTAIWVFFSRKYTDTLNKFSMEYLKIRLPLPLHINDKRTKVDELNFVKLLTFSVTDISISSIYYCK